VTDKTVAFLLDFPPKFAEMAANGPHRRVQISRPGESDPFNRAISGIRGCGIRLKDGGALKIAAWEGLNVAVACTRSANSGGVTIQREPIVTP
jgi:hypothetical protein